MNHADAGKALTGNDLMPSAPLAGYAARNQPGAWRALPILVFLFGLSLLDRQIMTLMVGPLKRDLGLSDFQVGVLQGLVFAIFYGAAAVPIGWLVDRFARRPIIWLGVTFWGLCAAACGLANSFAGLFAARLGVGAGEATLVPAAYSMLADLFKPSRLALAISILLIGSNLGNGMAIGLGGAIVAFAEKGGTLALPMVGHLRSWQFVFLVTGLPGVFLGGLIFLVGEPIRRGRMITAKSASFADTIKFMGVNRGFFAAHFLGFGLLAIVGWAFSSWLPTYMNREFGWSIGKLSVPLALIIGIAPSLGTPASGWIADRLFGRGQADAHLRVCCFIALGMAAFGVAAFRVHNPILFLILITPIAAIMANGATSGASLQIVAPTEMRGQITAMSLLVANGLGLGLGPMLVGALSDFVFGNEARLGDSLSLVFAVLAPAAAFVLWLGWRPMRSAVGRADQWLKDPLVP
jgi:MFS family permease